MIERLKAIFTRKTTKETTDMNTAAFQLALLIIEQAIKAEPRIAAAIRDMLQKGDPTEADWANLRAMVATPFEQLAPNAAEQIREAGLVAMPNTLDETPGADLPPEVTPAPAPAAPELAMNPLVKVGGGSIPV